MEQQVTYTTSNSYSTRNNLSKNTKNVWIVFHGIGYLSRYFSTFFDGLPEEDNYIIIPQAPAKYYLKNEYKHVGASWLTKENTAVETNNVLQYIDAIMAQENIPTAANLIVLGFSQGVSIATRWIANRKINCKQLVLYAGSIPKELTKDHFLHLTEETKLTIIVGNKDKLIPTEKLQSELSFAQSIFEREMEVITFDGGHEVQKSIINNLV